MGRLKVSVLVTALVVLAVAFAGNANADVYSCFGAPGGVRSDYPEPRVFGEAQNWWHEGLPSNMLSNIDDAMSANHIHNGICVPQGETIVPEVDYAGHPAIAIQMVGKAHNNVGGVLKNARGGLESGTTGVWWPGDVHPLPLGWKPVSDDETRVLPEGYQTLSRLQSIGCGRHEGRYTIDTTERHGRRQYQSFGVQMYVPCKPGQSPNPYRGTDLFIFRGWYQGGNYVNVNFADESGHSYTGFRASDMSDPIPDDWTVRYSLAQGANRALVSVDPDIHHGSFGTVIQRSTGTGPFNATIHAADFTPGIHKLMIAGCENVSSPAGESCGVGVIPFLVPEPEPVGAGLGRSRHAPVICRTCPR